MTAFAITQNFNRARLERLADGLAAAVAISLPWSVSAASILLVLWLIALLPTLDFEAARRQALTAAGGLPLVLLALGALGMLWTDVSWADRLHGFSSFLRLLAIPLLFVQFYRSPRGYWVLGGFLVSAAILLIVAIVTVLSPGGVLWGFANTYGVPVKDSIAQSAVFLLAAFGSLYLALQAFRSRRYGLAIALLFLIAGFLADIAYVVASRTALLTVPILLILFALTQFGWRRRLLFLAISVVPVIAIWASSSYVRERVGNIPTEITQYRNEDIGTSAGERIEFWKKSAGFIAQAPVIGHGTGSIPTLFARSAAGRTGVAGEPSVNPHNQTFAVGIQLGLVGIAVLYAMWVTHLLLFRGGGLAAWIGLVIVVQNIVGSLFNSHLFDFTQGWIYVFGVGVAGGMVLRDAAAKPQVT